MANATRGWLAEDAEHLVQRLDASRRERVDCDVLIIGSGYGGAVAAARLAGATVKTGAKDRPARVWLLERGREHLPGTFPATFAELPGEVRFGLQDGGPPRGRSEALLDLRIGKDASVLLGNGLGGGSLINAGVMLRPPGAVFETGWPAAFNARARRRAYARAKVMLGATPVPAALETPKLHELDRLAVHARLAAQRPPVAVHWAGQPGVSAACVPLQPCQRCGACLTGCNHGAKGTLDTNYLAHAAARGARLFCGGVVEWLEPVPDVDGDGPGESHWRVWWHYTDPALRQPLPMCVRARRVVLAAGSLGSTEILMRSRARGLRLTDRLGEGFSINGDRIVAAIAPEGTVVNATPTPSHVPVGPTITGKLRVPADATGPGFLVEEFSVPSSLGQAFGEVVSTLRAFQPGAPVGPDPHAVEDTFVQRIGLYGLMGDDGAGGRLSWPAPPAGAARAVEAGIAIEWPKAPPTPVSKQMDAWIAAHAAAADFVPRPADNLVAPLMAAVSVHPLGGCRMADSPQNGVVDDHGRVFRAEGGVHEGLAVLDGAIVPRALGVNPAWTIAALAEHALPRLMDDWGLKPGGQAAALPPRPQVEREPIARAPTHWAIRERLAGPCVLDGHPYWAALDIALDEVHGWREFLGSANRTVPVVSAQLRLWAAPPNVNAFQVDTNALTLCCTADLAGQVTLFQLPAGAARPDPNCTMLCYDLVVQQSTNEALLAPAASLEGRKHLGPWKRFPPSAAAATPRSRDNPWRQLSEIEMAYMGQSIGRWTLDFDDLADQRQPLLRITQQSSMPDALADLGALGLYLLRRDATRLTAQLGQILGDRRNEEALAQRLPGVLASGVSPEVIALPSGARLSRYRRLAPGGGDPTPLLLIHGLGTSGASFTHAAIGTSLADHLWRSGREVWVLDVCSSVGNERDRHGAPARAWTVDDIAVRDVPQALEAVTRIGGASQVDVVAHCMGAVMFCLAALKLQDLRRHVRSAVLSQVGPLVRLSPLNRLRGYVGAYLRQYLGIEEIDTRPDLQSELQMDGRLQWSKRQRGAFSLLMDALAGTFPLPDDDDERGRYVNRPDSDQRDFRHVRHRADAAFGQLFELVQLNDDTLTHLDALLGWVKVGMLAQGIHFARQHLLTDVRGRNRLLDSDRLRYCFDFPLLILHGRRNRVFDWRGSRDSLRVLAEARGLAAPAASTPLATPAIGEHFGAGTSVQLAVLEDYGHLDCIIGARAHAEVFPLIAAFHDGLGAQAGAVAPPAPTIEADEPWWGPMLGWLRPARAGGHRLRLLARAHPRRARTQGVAIVSMLRPGAAWVPDLTQVRVRRWDGEQPLDLFVPAADPAAPRTFAFLTLHANDNANLRSGRPTALVRAALTHAFGRLATQPERLQACLFTLREPVLAAADQGPPPQAGGSDRPALCFALASCQYPPGLFDEQPAGAALRRLCDGLDGKAAPAFLVLAGDQIYADATAGVFEPVGQAPAAQAAPDIDYDQAYELNWRQPAFRATAAQLPLVPMLDDHEVADNWQGFEAGPRSMDRQARRALVAYRRHQGGLAPVRRLEPQDWRTYHFYPQGVPFFVLDTRTHRDRRDASRVADADILSKGVLQALLDQLWACPADGVKFIVSPSPVLPPERVRGPGALRSDTWSGFPAARVRLLEGLCQRNIRRVVFLSGDSHLSTVSRLRLADGFSVVSIVSSGLYTPWPFANQQPHELVLKGAVDLGTPQSPYRGHMRCLALSPAAGYARIRLRPQGAAMALEVDLCAADGTTVSCRLQLS